MQFSFFIRFGLLNRVGHIHSISSAILCPPSRHITQFKVSSVLKPIFYVSPPFASSRFPLIVLAFSCHLLRDLRQLLKHYHHPFSPNVRNIYLHLLLPVYLVFFNRSMSIVFFSSLFLSVTFRPHMVLTSFLYSQTCFLIFSATPCPVSTQYCYATTINYTFHLQNKPISK